MNSSTACTRREGARPPRPEAAEAAEAVDAVKVVADKDEGVKELLSLLGVLSDDASFASSLLLRTNSTAPRAVQR